MFQGSFFGKICRKPGRPPLRGVPCERANAPEDVIDTIHLFMVQSGLDSWFAFLVLFFARRHRSPPSPPPLKVLLPDPKQCCL